jgi:hypothetical protein
MDVVLKHLAQSEKDASDQAWKLQLLALNEQREDDMIEVGNWEGDCNDEIIEGGDQRNSLISEQH